MLVRKKSSINVKNRMILNDKTGAFTNFIKTLENTNFNTQTFYNNMCDIKFEETHRFTQDKTALALYDLLSNKIQYLKDYYKYAIMHELFHMASTVLDGDFLYSGFFQKDLKSGEEVEITLKLDSFNDIKKGINAYKATLDYDEKIFEQVFQNSFECLNGWEDLLYNPSTKEFVSIKRAGTTKAENVAKIKLKVKKGMKATKTSIKVKDAVVSEGKRDIFVNEKSIQLNIFTEQTSIPSDNDNNNNSNNSSNNTNNVSNGLSTTKTVLGTMAKSN